METVKKFNEFIKLNESNEFEDYMFDKFYDDNKIKKDEDFYYEMLLLDSICSLTYYGLLSLYKVFYSDSTEFFEEYIQNIFHSFNERKGVEFDYIHANTRKFILEKILDKVTIEELIKELTEDKKYLNHCREREMFNNFKNADDWKEEFLEEVNSSDYPWQL